MPIRVWVGWGINQKIYAEGQNQQNWRPSKLPVFPALWENPNCQPQKVYQWSCIAAVRMIILMFSNLFYRLLSIFPLNVFDNLSRLKREICNIFLTVTTTMYENKQL